MDYGFQSKSTANMRCQSIEGIGFITSEMALTACPLKKHLNSLALELPDRAAGAMVNIKLFGPVVKKFGTVEGFLVADAVQVRRIELTRRQMGQPRAPGTHIDDVIHTGFMGLIVSVDLNT